MTTRTARLDWIPARTQVLWPYLNGAVLRRALLVALILGSALTLINQPGAVFGPAEVQLLSLAQVYLTPFAVVVIAQLLGARRARTDASRGRAGGTAEETFLTTAMTHGIPFRAAALALLVGGLNALSTMLAALLDPGSPGALPLPLLAQAFSLPLVFGTLTQTLAYRRAARALVAQ